MKESSSRKASGMGIAVGLLHGVQPVNGQSSSVLAAGVITMLMVTLLGAVVWAAVSRPRPTGGGGWWRRHPDGQPSPWRPIPGLGPSRRPRRAGLRSPVCPIVRTERFAPAPAPSRISVPERPVASARS